MVQRVADCLGSRSATWQLRYLHSEPGAELLKQRTAAVLALGVTCLGALAADLGLDPIQRGDTRQRLGGDRRRATLGEIIEVAPDMAPAERQSAWPAPA